MGYKLLSVSSSEVIISARSCGSCERYSETVERGIVAPGAWLRPRDIEGFMPETLVWVKLANLVCTFK